MKAAGLDTAFLETKLYRPVVREKAVARPRLVRRLLHGIDTRLTVLAAPAGFGKSTLLAQALEEVMGPVAWVSLDAGDNDTVRFWTYVCTALERAVPGAAGAAPELLQASPPELEPALAELVNGLARGGTEAVLVLDDYHEIDNADIHRSLTYLLEHAPRQVHVVIAGRNDPPLPLARWRVRGKLLELRAADLRFSAEEAVKFFNETMGLELDWEQAEILETRTEGWAAGLQLAALSLQGQAEAAAFIRTFGGSHRHVADYLVEEVLSRQPASVRAFLLQTSVLERLSAGLCKAVVGEAATDGARPAHKILAQLERENLFLIALDDERRWYRYHHLFADLLRQQLVQEFPELVPELHRRAALWFEEREEISSAVDHALAADDMELVSRLVATYGVQVAAKGETQTLQRWLEAFPEATLLSDPRLCVARAWVLMLARRLLAMEPYLDAAEAALRIDGGPADVALRGELLALRAHVSLEHGAFEEAYELARQALEMLPDAELWARSSSMLVLGYALYLLGETSEAEMVYSQCVALCRAAGNVVGALFSAAEVIKLQMLQGRPGDARASAEDALRQAEVEGWAELPPASALHIRLADVLIEVGDLAAADAELVHAVQLTGQEPAITVARAQIFLARLRQLQGNTEAANKALAAVEEMSMGWEAGGERAFFDAYVARIRLMQGELAAARRWAEERTPWQRSERPSYFREIELLTMARVAILDPATRTGEASWVNALALLAWLQEQARAGGRGLVVLEARSLAALALARAGRAVEAQSQLDQALTVAAATDPADSFVGVFLDLGGPMRDLLIENAARRAPDDPLHSYVARLLEALAGVVARQAPNVGAGARPWMGSDLTSRELDVLRLLAVGLSGPEIAEQLVVSINTVKTQMKSIYSKLDAHSREEALEKAREAGLLR